MLLAKNWRLIENRYRESRSLEWTEDFDFSKGDPLLLYLNGQEVAEISQHTGIELYGADLKKVFDKSKEPLETCQIINFVLFEYSDYHSQIFARWIKFFADRFERLEEVDKLLWGLAEVCASVDHNVLKDLSDDETILAHTLLDLMLDDKIHFSCYSNVKKLLSFVSICVRFESKKIESFGVLKNVLPREITNGPIIELFRQLFEVYPVSDFLLTQFEFLSPKEVELTIDLMQGSILHRLNLPWLEKLSKKENYVFSNILTADGNYFLFSEGYYDIINRGIIYAKVLKARPQDIDCFWQMILYSNTMQRNLEHVKNNLKFWRDLFVFLSDNAYVSFFHGNRVGEILDYFEDGVVREEKNFRFSGRTRNSIMRLVDEWHREQSLKELEEVEHVTWRGMGIEPFYGELDGRKITIEEITSAKELHQEGRVLEHCVFSYIDNCVKGFSKVFSMRRIDGDWKESFLTIELTDSNIVKQVRGEKNRTPKKAELVLLNEWAISHGFNTSLLGNFE